MTKTFLDAMNQAWTGSPSGLILVPDGSITLVDLASAQTLTNKTLTLPTLNGPSIVNGNFPNTAALSAGGASLAVTSTLAGRQTILNRAAGVAVTLPAAVGSGNVYTFVVGISASGGNYVISAASGTDFFRGMVFSKDDGTTSSVISWATANTGTVATESDILTLNGSTQGGLIGDMLIFSDIAAATWSVIGFTKSSGVEATPFSVGV